MNNYNIITVTRARGLRAVRGARFKVTHLDDGRHFLKCCRGGLDDLQIDVELLTSSDHIQISHRDHPKTPDSPGEYTDWFVTLRNVGLAKDCQNKFVLVKPTPSDLPHVDGLTGVCDPVLVWFPEEQMTRVNTGISAKEAQWITPNLVRLLTMSSLWMEWKDPHNSNGRPVSIKVETHSGDCFLEEGFKTANSKLTAYKSPF
jgi:hypothetical protein